MSADWETLTPLSSTNVQSFEYSPSRGELLIIFKNGFEVFIRGRPAICDGRTPQLAYARRIGREVRCATNQGLLRRKEGFLR
jgi:hypothetical protein